MIAQHPDGMIIEAPGRHSFQEHRLWQYRMEVAADLLDEQGSLIDRLICFAFDTLGAIHLDLRVHPTECRPTTTQPRVQP